MLFLALLAAAAAPQPGDLRTFGDWTVGCDNGLRCQAVGLMPERAEEGALTATIIRGPAATDAPRITINGNGDGADTATMLVDGRRFALRGADGDYEPADPAAFLAALVRGRKAVLVDGGGKAIGTLSPAGVSAALLYVDDRQHRVGTPGALIRKGREGTIPAPPAYPVVRRAASGDAAAITPGAADIAALRDRVGCDAGDFGPVSADSYPLDARRSLLLLSCGAGAYNLLTVPFVIERGGGGRIRADIAPFDAPPVWGEEKSHPMLVNAEYEDGTLIHYAKGRGLGDCGISQQFTWDGARFRLTGQREMNECRGSLDWIPTWHAEVRG